MQRYTPGILPKQGTVGPMQAHEELRPLAGAERLCALIRGEHGRAGVARFMGALAPFVPRDFLMQLAERCGVDCPPAAGLPPQRPPEKPRENPAIKPEQLLKLMNMGGGGGLDPAALLKLMGEMNK